MRHSEFTFGPAYHSGLFGANGKLSAFCKGNSSTQSNPNNSQTVTDNRVAASDGGQAATGGGSITNNNVSGDIIKENNDALMGITSDYIDLGKEAIYSSTDTAKAAAQAAADAAYSATQSNATVASAAIGENADVSKAAINAGVTQTGYAFDFGRDIYHESQGALTYANDNAASLAKAALALADNSQKGANDLIRDTNTDFTQKLVANQGLAASTLQDNFGKYITIGGVAVAIVIAVALFKKN